MRRGTWSNGRFTTALPVHEATKRFSSFRNEGDLPAPLMLDAMPSGGQVFSWSADLRKRFFLIINAGFVRLATRIFDCVETFFALQRLFVLLNFVQ